MKSMRSAIEKSRVELATAASVQSIASRRLPTRVGKEQRDQTIIPHLPPYASQYRDLLIGMEKKRNEMG
jgi:hypothetical protein